MEKVPGYHLLDEMIPRDLYI